MYRVEEIRLFDKRYGENYWVCSIALNKLGVFISYAVEYYIALVNIENNETTLVDAKSVSFRTV